MAVQYPTTPADNAAWARLWDLASAPWERLADLASFLGVGRTTVLEWGPDGRHPGSGPWSLLRLALRRTARRYPETIPGLVEALVLELLDARGKWVPESSGVGQFRDESDDVLDAHATLVRLARAGAGPEAIAEAAGRLVREANECAAAAVRA